MATQGAAVLWLATSGRGSVGTVGVAAAAAVVLACWLRLRRRWLYRWLAVATRYAVRRRRLPAGADTAALLDWARPGARIVGHECDGEPAGIIEEARGLTAVLGLGHPDVLLTEKATPLPPLTALAAPGVHLHLVVAGVAPAGGPGAPAASYRQLTEGRPLARQHAVLAVQALRVEGTEEEELHRVLGSAVRRIRRRLRDGAGARLLTEPALRGVLADLAHHDGASPAREGWGAVHLGGLAQTSYRLRRWPRQASPQALVPHLLGVPAAATTVGLSIGPDSAAALAVRLAAPTSAALAVAAQALRRVLDGYGAAAQRCDGEQAWALAATLPLGGDHGRRPVRPEALAALVPAVGGAGLVLGVNRQGAAVTAALLRAEPTRALVVGGVRVAQLLTLRALALGAQVAVRTARPQAWEPFVRGVSAPGEAIAVVPPGRLPAAFADAGAPLRPQLVVVDTGPAQPDTAVPEAAWRTSLVVRDELAAADLDLLARSDLLVLQPLRPDEAALAGDALGLGAAGEWLTRIQGDMIGAINRRTVLWALLSATPVEQQLLGPITRG